VLPVEDVKWATGDLEGRFRVFHVRFRPSRRPYMVLVSAIAQVREGHCQCVPRQLCPFARGTRPTRLLLTAQCCYDVCMRDRLHIEPNNAAPAELLRTQFFDGSRAISPPPPRHSASAVEARGPGMRNGEAHRRRVRTMVVGVVWAVALGIIAIVLSVRWPHNTTPATIAAFGSLLAGSVAGVVWWRSSIWSDDALTVVVGKMTSAGAAGDVDTVAAGALVMHARLLAVGRPVIPSAAPSAAAGGTGGEMRNFGMLTPPFPVNRTFTAPPPLPRVCRGHTG